MNTFKYMVHKQTTNIFATIVILVVLAISFYPVLILEYANRNKGNENITINNAETMVDKLLRETGREEKDPNKTYKIFVDNNGIGQLLIYNNK